MLAVVMVTVFAAVFVCAFATVAIAARWFSPEAVAANSEYEELQLSVSRILKDESLSTIGVLDRFLGKLDVSQRLRVLISEAAVNWSVGRVVAAMLLLSAFAFAILIQFSSIPFWAAGIVAMGAGWLPWLALLRLRERRLERFEQQFPDVLDSLCGAMRAGHPLAQSISIVADENPGPVGSELARVFEERKLGSSLEDALEAFAQRIPLVDVSLFVAAVQLQGRTGGNVAEVLSRLAETMREASALRGEVRAIAASGKLNGLVLTCLPFLLVGVLSLLNPGYFGVLLADPVGRNLVFAALFALVLAHFIIQRIVDIDV